MDQSSVSADSKKPYAFPFRKRNHKGKPVIPSSQFDYHNESIYSLYNDINVKVEDNESKPNEDRQGNNNLWSFQEYSNRKFQISIPEETINTSSNWTHLKVFRENVEGEFVLHQFLMLSVWELKIFIQKLPEMIKEALQFEPSEVTAKLMIDETLFQPTDVEEKAKFDVFWELSETARRKVCVTRTFYQDDPYRCYFIIKLFTRGTEKDSFRRKCFLSVRIGELQKIIRMSNEIISVLNKVKNQTKSQSA